MAFDKGFNFRGTAGYVTDGANQTYVLSSDVYPVTRNGVTFGWVTNVSIAGADRDNTVDVRLAGINYEQPSTAESFRVDLTAAADYAISLANGDTASSQTTQVIEVFDNTTSLFTVNNASVAQDTYYDATNVNRTEANWPSLNAANTKTFSSTIFKITLGSGSSSYTLLAHLFLSQVVAGGDTLFAQAVM